MHESWQPKLTAKDFHIQQPCFKSSRKIESSGHCIPSPLTCHHRATASTSTTSTRRHVQRSIGSIRIVIIITIATIIIIIITITITITINPPSPLSHSPSVLVPKESLSNANPTARCACGFMQSDAVCTHLECVTVCTIGAFLQSQGHARSR